MLGALVGDGAPSSLTDRSHSLSSLDSATGGARIAPHHNGIYIIILYYLRVLFSIFTFLFTNFYFYGAELVACGAFTIAPGLLP